MTENVTTNDPYLLVEEVAERLGLPLSVLLNRVEAGDIPATRIEREDGVVHYALRLSDLGIDLDDGRGTAIFDESDSVGLESAIASAFNGGGERAPSAEAEPLAEVDVTGRRVESDEGAAPAATDAEAASEDGGPVPRPWSVRPREPQEPPEWLMVGRAAAEPAAEAAPAVGGEEIDDPATADPFEEATAADATDAPDAPDADPDVPPPPGRTPAVQLLDPSSSGPRGELAAISLDARDLVAGLLDRWERTLEQRIYTEQRQRFQGELTARQTMVKQLQMELHTARAEHAAAQAGKDRVLAEKERELADRERDLADSRRLAADAERMIAPAASARRRRWFRGRDD
jgi:hypothetical protein